MSVDAAWLRGWIIGASASTPGKDQALACLTAIEADGRIRGLPGARIASIETQSLTQAVRSIQDGDELLWWYHSCGSVAAMPEAPTDRHDCGYTDPWRPMLVGQL